MQHKNQNSDNLIEKYEWKKWNERTFSKWRKKRDRHRLYYLKFQKVKLKSGILNFWAKNSKHIYQRSQILK